MDRFNGSMMKYPYPLEIVKRRLVDYRTKYIRPERVCFGSCSKEQGIYMCNALGVGKSVCDHMIYKCRICGASD